MSEAKTKVGIKSEGTKLDERQSGSITINLSQRVLRKLTFYASLLIRRYSVKIYGSNIGNINSLQRPIGHEHSGQRFVESRSRRNGKLQLALKMHADTDESSERKVLEVYLQVINQGGEDKERQQSAGEWLIKNSTS
jgi:hypothetical protein